MKRYPQWNYTEVLTALGGDNRVAELIRNDGYNSPPTPTIKGWRHRNAIPGRWAPLIILIALREGVLPSLRSLIKQAPVPGDQSNANLQADLFDPGR